MVDGSKLGARAYRLLLIVFLASAVLAAWIGQRRGGPSSRSEPLDAWDIPRLSVYLNDKGMALGMVSTQKDGIIDRSAFLTITDKKWDDLDRLCKDPTWIGRWRGILYCERNLAGDDLARQWGDYGLRIGPFLFYGDPELLAHVREALAPLASSEDRLR